MDEAAKTHKLIMTFRTRNGRRKEESFPVTADDATEVHAKAAAISRAQMWGDGQGWSMVNHRFEEA